MDLLKPDQHVTHDDGLNKLNYYRDLVQSGDTSDPIKSDSNPVLNESIENKVHSKVHEDTIFKDQNDLENAQHTETIAPDANITENPFEVKVISGDTHHEETESGVNQVVENVIRDNRPHETDNIRSDSHQEHINPSIESIKEDTHEKSTEGATEVIKDGKSSDEVHETESIAEGSNPDFLPNHTESISENSHDIKSESGTDQIHENAKSLAEQIHTAGTSDLQIAQDTIRHDVTEITDEIKSDTTVKLMTEHTDIIKHGETPEVVQSTELITDGTSGSTEHQTEMISEGTESDSVNQTETIAENANSEVPKSSVDSIATDAHEESTEESTRSIAENTQELSTEGITAEMASDTHEEVNESELASINSDTHEEVTESEVTEIKSAEVGNTDYNQPTISDPNSVDTRYQNFEHDSSVEDIKPDTIVDDSPIDTTLTIAEGTQGDGVGETVSIADDSHQESNEGITELIKNGTSGYSEHETEQVLEDAHSEQTEGTTLTIAEDSTEHQAEYSDPEVKSDQHEEVTEGETEEVKSGKSSDTTYEDPQVLSDTHEEVKDGDTEVIKSGETGDSDYETESIKSGDKGDSDYQTLNIAEGETGESDYQTEMMKGEDAEEVAPETDQINSDTDLSEDYSLFAHTDAGTEEIKPDLVTDDSPIDKVEVIGSDIHTIKTEGETEVIKGTPTDIGYDRDYSGTGTTRGDWSQVPFVGDVVGLATSAYNGVVDDVNALLKDKRYQVYLATQALGDILVDKIYGTGMMSPTQMLAFANKLKNTFTVKNAAEALIGGLVSLIKGKGFHFDIGPINIPKRGLPIDQLDGPLIYKLATRMGGDNANVTRFKMEMDKLVMDDPPSINNPTALKKLQSNYIETITSEFYKEFKKVVLDPVKDDGSYSLETKVENLQYWDGTNMAATNKYDAPFKGRKSIMGFSLDSSHLWDIALFPYKGEENGNKTELPNTPTQNKDDGSDAWIPAISYSFSDYKMESKNIPAALGFSEMSIPLMRTNTQDFNMMVIDDQYGHWCDYFHKVSKATASVDGLEVVPYKNVTFQLNLFILDVGAHIRYYRKLLVVLKDWEKQHTGEEDPAIVTYNLNFQIVGEITEKNKDEQNI